MRGVDVGTVGGRVSAGRVKEEREACDAKKEFTKDGRNSCPKSSTAGVGVGPDRHPWTGAGEPGIDDDDDDDETQKCLGESRRERASDSRGRAARR